MSSIHGVGGSSGINNNALDNTQDVNHPETVDKLGKTAPTQGVTGSEVQKPGLTLQGVGTGVAYSQPSPLEPKHLVLPGSLTESTNVDITACLVLLMQTAMQMRRDQREQWTAQAQTALSTAQAAADKQVEAAKSKLIAECCMTGISAAVSIGSAAVSIGSAAMEGSASKATSAKADAIYGTDAQIKGTGSTADADADSDVDVNVKAKSIISTEGLTGDSIGGDVAEVDNSGTKNMQKSLSKTQEAQVQKAEVKDAEIDTTDKNITKKQAEQKSEANIAEQMKKKEEFKAQVNYSETSRIENKAKALNSIIELGNSAGKLVGANLTYQSEMESAEASKIKALADFQNSAAADQLDFANELRDYANSILSTIRNVESARHAASNAIANI